MNKTGIDHLDIKSKVFSKRCLTAYWMLMNKLKFEQKTVISLKGMGIIGFCIDMRPISFN